MSYIREHNTKNFLLTEGRRARKKTRRAVSKAADYPVPRRRADDGPYNTREERGWDRGYQACREELHEGMSSAFQEYEPKILALIEDKAAAEAVKKLLREMYGEVVY